MKVEEREGGRGDGRKEEERKLVKERGKEIKRKKFMF